METRKLVIMAIFGVVGLIHLAKLFTIQVSDASYQVMAEDNMLQEVVQYPNRGLMFDRNGKLLVGNAPQFSLMVVPKEVPKNIDVASLCELLGITPKEYDERMQKAKKYSYVKASAFIKELSHREYATMQDLLVNYPGFYIQPRTIRTYPDSLLGNAVGYIGEISKRGLEEDSTKYYRQGDYIGISGLESEYENYLRGKRGIRYVMVNVRGVEKGAFRGGRFDTLPVPGENITTTIDLELQEYAEKLMDGKVGSVVAIEPKTGEVLSIVSAPFYDPHLLSGKGFGQNFLDLNKDSLKPLFNRPVQAMYPPGSIFKAVQSLIAMQEGVVTANEQVYCSAGPMGDHAPFGFYDVSKAIKYSSNTYFYLIFRRIINQNKDPNTYKDSQIGLNMWRDYLDKFGFGRQLGIDLPSEKTGFMPASTYYDKVYGGELTWKFSTIYSLSIGQGEMLVTPLQMANLSAIIANKGYYVTPHLVKSIGEEGYILPEYRKKHFTGIDSSYYEPVIEGMSQVVFSTARRAYVPDIEICGKTGTAENPHGPDHSVFIAFAPRENPKIAISVYVENAGWGGRAAASTASLMIEKYLNGEVKRKWLEDYVLKGEFLDKDQLEN